MIDKRDLPEQQILIDVESLGAAPLAVRVQELRTSKQFVVRYVSQLPRRSRIRWAVEFAVSAVRAYWHQLQIDYPKHWRLAPCSIESHRSSLDEDSRGAAEDLGYAAAKVDPVTAGYFIGTTYAAALPRELRAQLGVYYTPPALASRLLDQATAAGVDWSVCSVLDPACGGGAFLAPAAERMMKELSHFEPGALLVALAGRLRGFEIDPVAAWMSQVFLEATVLPLCRAAGRRLPMVVEVRNSLVHESGETQFDLVVGNPPYGRITLSPRIRARYAGTLYGHANLYGLFTDLALRWVKPSGVVAYVTPTSFLAGEYFKNLRVTLGRTAPPYTVDFIAERKGVFDAVLQETLLATYRRDAAPGAASVAFITPIDESDVRVTPVGAFVLPEDPGSPWLLPRDPAEARLTTVLRRMRHRLRDWGYEVSTGPLVWNRHKDQLRADPAPGCYPLVWAEAVTPDGRFLFRSTKPNHRPYFKAHAGDDWLVIENSCVIVQRTTAKEQARRLIAAVLPPEFIRRHGGAVVENHLNMIRSRSRRPLVSPAAVAVFLNSAIADRVFRCLSGSVAVSAYELEALPLPAADQLTELEAAVRRGESFEALNSICTGLYGLTILP